MGTSRHPLTRALPMAKFYVSLYGHVDNNGGPLNFLRFGLSQLKVNPVACVQSPYANADTDRIDELSVTVYMPVWSVVRHIASSSRMLLPYEY